MISFFQCAARWLLTRLNKLQFLNFWIPHNLNLKMFWLCAESYSLSKCSNYPLFIFLCPKIESKKYPWKKTESLNYPNSIWEILAMSQIFSMFFKNLCFLLNENSRCLYFFTDTVWILENLHKFQLIIWDIAEISWIVF